VKLRLELRFYSGKWWQQSQAAATIASPSSSHPATHQDGRKLRRYKRRWVIERTNSWLQNFRRLVARYERKAKNFEALVHLACALVTLKKV
jgi:transposase